MTDPTNVEIAHILIDLIADLTEPSDMDSYERTARTVRIREAHEAITPPETVVAPALGNEEAEEGVDRCWCGCKYWEYDRCIDCGTRFDPAMRNENR